MLFGREHEVQLLNDLIDRARERGETLVVRGEAGIGKSSLLAEARGRARDRGFQILTTTGVQSEAHLPFAGLHQLLRPILMHVDRLPPPQRNAMRAAFGMTDAAAPDQFLIALAALNLLTEAAHSPLLLVVEDAQWLDHSTAEVLLFVARRIESEPIALLIAIRDGYDDSLASVGTELHLEGLDKVKAGQLLDATAPGLAPAVRERLLDEAEGNPLALVELPAALGSEERSGGRALPAQLPLTARLEREFAMRLTELPAATQTLVLVAAVDDSSNLSEILGAAAVVDGNGHGIDALTAAVSARLVEVDETDLYFRHPLVRSAIHQSATISQRHVAHAALAEVLTGQPDRRVWHLASSSIGLDEDIASELEAAAARAQRRGGIVVAVAALERAAELSTDPRQRGRRLLRAADLAFELGRRDLVVRLLEQAERLDLRPVEHGRVTWLREMITPRVLRNPAEVRSLVESADHVRREGDTDLALNLLWLVASRCWWADLGKEVQASVIDAAERLGPVDDDLRLLAIVAYADPIARARVVIERLGRALPDGDGDPEATRLLGTAAGVVGAFDLASRFLAAAAAGLRAQGRLGHLARVLVLHAWAAAYLADWTTAVPAAEEARRLALETGEPLWVAGAKAVLALVAGRRGDAEATEMHALEAERIALPFGASFMLAAVQIARGASFLGAGRDAEAYENLLRLFNPADPAHHSFMCSWAIGDLAEAAVHTGHREEARQVVEVLTPLVDQTPSPWFHIGMRYARAVLANDEEAEALFQAALDADLTRWPFDRARALLAYGTWLRRQRRVAESRAPLRAARDAFDALGVVAWGERARQELRASGETSRQRMPTPWDQLTPQELQIAQMAAEGLTNREIAHQLYLSHRTVSSHLYRIFPKLGITARFQLRDVLNHGAGSPT